MPILDANKKKSKPHSLPSPLREEIDAETAEIKAAKVEFMIEAKVAQALHVLRF